MIGMKWGFWALLFILMVSCKGDKQDENMLSEVEMAEVMLDIYRAEVWMSSNRTGIRNEQLYPVLKQRALEKHNINDSVFRLNVKYYLLHPEKLNEVYDIMIDSVKLDQQEEASVEKQN